MSSHQREPWLSKAWNPFRRTTHRIVGIQMMIVGAVATVVVLALSAADVIESAGTRTAALTIASGIFVAGVIILIASTVTEPSTDKTR